MTPKMIAVGDTLLSISDWAKTSGINRDTIVSRIRSGWMEKDAVTKPAYRRSDRHYKTVSVGNGESVNEHVLIAEIALGKALPKGAVVHHADGDKNNNVNSNLVICPSQSYHALLHARMDAMEKSGDPGKRLCSYCKKYDEVSNLSYSKSSRKSYHKSCDALRARIYRKSKKSQATTSGQKA